MAVICTDAGHGGSDSGAVWNGVREKGLNLQVVLKFNQWLKQRGHRVFTTRKSDQKVPPLKTRCRLINAHHLKQNPAFDAIISIHCNVAAVLEKQRSNTYPSLNGAVFMPFTVKSLPQVGVWRSLLPNNAGRMILFWRMTA